ncbi:glycoside hydrolase family 28 protein [Mucilaginibacter sp.]|uniref:glycoside hydrolase family 28 protein n=1 Tax=Mucilaginibacter sp. TaxID=1882438 RepID=UPI002C2DD4EB|nr:glycoside hydrolase family 28 protein [Mucilaginibacter sp.]HTI60292.1 glycoside hydrolase family 28 protein [Mucilaginibacter sp.]
MRSPLTTNALLSCIMLVIVTATCALAQTNKPSPFSWKALPTAKRPVFKKDTFNITKYGAVAFSDRLNTASIKTAIEKCHAAGGGVVLIPKGNWLTGPIILKSNVNLHLAKGAVLQFTTDKNQYPLIAANFEGHETVRDQSPISGDDLTNVAITGQGTVEGNGDAWRPLYMSKQTSAQWQDKLKSGGVLSDDGKTWFPSQQYKLGQEMSKKGKLEKLKTIADFAPVKDYLRPNLLVLTRCKQVLLESVTFQNSPCWCLHTLMCVDLTVSRVKVNNPAWAQNGDGLDIESCKNVVVEHSSFNCGDDGLCIKSGKDEQGRKRGMPTENVTIHDDTVYQAHGGFVIGSEMSGGARNIFVYHCAFIGSDKGLRFKTARGRGGLVNNIFVKDIYMKDIIQEAIYFDMYYFTAPPKPGQAAPVFAVDETTPRFQDFYISDIHCESAGKALFIRGLPEMHIKNIDLQNIYLKAKTGIEIIEADDIHLKNLQVDASKNNPVVYIENSTNIDFKGLDIRENSEVLFNVGGAKTKNISVSGLKTKEVGTQANFIGGADKSALRLN